MYRVEIGGTYCGHFKTAAEALKAVDARARSSQLPWVITDSYGWVYARS